MPIRGNLGLELWVGNGPDDGESRHPFTSPPEAALVRSLGEHRYNEWCRHRAIAWMRANPRAAAGRALQRYADYWVGPYGLDRPRIYFAAGGVDAGKLLMQGLPVLLALLGLALSLRRRSPAGALAAWAFLLVPLPYIVTQAGDPRYRHPLDPLIFLLAGHAVCRVASLALRLVPEKADAGSPETPAVAVLTAS